MVDVPHPHFTDKDLRQRESGLSRVTQWVGIRDQNSTSGTLIPVLLLTKLMFIPTYSRVVTVSDQLSGSRIIFLFQETLYISPSFASLPNLIPMCEAKVSFCVHHRDPAPNVDVARARCTVSFKFAL